MTTPEDVTNHRDGSVSVGVLGIIGWVLPEGARYTIHRPDKTRIGIPSLKTRREATAALLTHTRVEAEPASEVGRLRTEIERLRGACRDAIRELDNRATIKCDGLEAAVDAARETLERALEPDEDA